MTREQLEQQRQGVEAQMRWAVLHGGDQELLDLLRVEMEHLSVKISQFPVRPDHSVAPSLWVSHPRRLEHTRSLTTVRKQKRPRSTSRWGLGVRTA
jgi:hypothetical protein